MNRLVGWITFVVFLLFVAGGVVTVLALATSTGLGMGGSLIKTGATAADVPFQTQTGWVRNNSPWPIQITGVDVNDSGTVSAPVVYLSKTNDDPLAAAGQPPAWALTPTEFPYTLEGGGLRYFGFGVVPASGKVASFDKITVKFRGPLDFSFDSSYSGVAVAVVAPDLAPELLAADPSEDPGSLDTYLGIVKAALATGDLGQLQISMGDGATPEEATALQASQAGFAADMAVLSKVLTEDSRSWSVQFYRTDAAVDGLPPLSLIWNDFRWSVSPSAQ